MPADLHRVDQNIQAIRQIETAWSRPVLPDEVKLDLAGNGIMDPASLSVFLSGVDEDLTNAERTQPQPTRWDVGEDMGQPTMPPVGYERRTRMGAFYAGLADLPAPQVFDHFGPQNLKRRLVQGGYLDLPEEEVQSDRWLPEYSYAASQHAYDEMSRRFAGNKPGAISLESITQFLDEWLSPRGLYRAALELDLWWDFDKIGEEFQDWGNKLQRWRDDPVNARNLIDLVTGPLDDILFPVLNLGLMFTGVGQVMAVGRAVLGGVKGAKAVAGLHSGAKGLRFQDEIRNAANLSKNELGAITDIERFSRPSFTGGHIGRIGPGNENTMSRAMEAWRRQGAVILTKKANQQAIKLGATSRLQQVIDSDRGGASFDHLSGGQLGEGVWDALQNPMYDWAVDLLFFPPNVWQVGTFSRPARAIADGFRTGFLKTAQNENLTAAFYRPALKHLEESAGPQAASAFKKDVKQEGVQKALANHMFGGDEEKMGRFLQESVLYGAVDNWARQAADAVQGGAVRELDSATRSLYHRSKNVATGRLQILNEHNIEDLITHAAKYGDDIASSPAQWQKAMRQVRESYLEPADVAAARKGAVAEDHQRFVGSVNVETGQIDWRPLDAGPGPRSIDDLAGDEFFFHGVRRPDDIASVQEQGLRSGGFSGSLEESRKYKGADNTFVFRRDQFPEGFRDQDRIHRLYDPRFEHPAGGVGKPVSVEDAAKMSPGEIAEIPRPIGIIQQGKFRAFGSKVEGDPFFVDIHKGELREGLGDLAEEVLTGREALPEVFTRRYLTHDETGAYRHFRLSEAEKVRNYDPERLTMLRGLARRHNELRADAMNEMLREFNKEALEAYLYEMLATGQRYGDHLPAIVEIERVRQLGMLDNVRYATPMSEANRKLSAMPVSPTGVKWTDEMFKLFVELPDDPKLYDQLMKSVFAPFARHVHPQQGTFAAARIDPETGTLVNPSKQEALAFRAGVDRILNLHKALRRIRHLDHGEVMIGTTAKAAEQGVTSKPGLIEALTEVLGDAAFSDTTVSQLRALRKVAADNGVSVDDVERVLVRKIEELNASPKWAERFGVSSQDVRVTDVVQELEGKVKELQRQSAFMASEVTGAPDSLVRLLDERGYRLVHGTQFLHPFDLEGVAPHLADATMRQLRQQSFGAFFSRQQPDAVSVLKARKMRDSLHAELSKVDPGEKGRRLHLGDRPDPDNVDMESVMNDMYEIWRDVNDGARETLDRARERFPLARVGARWSLARIPFDPSRLPSDVKNFVGKVVARGYSPEQAHAIERALRQAQHLGFRQHGIFAMETKLRSTPNLTNAMRLLGATDASNRFRKIARGGAGAIAGAMAPNVMMDDPDSDPGLMARAGGMVAGAALGASKLGIPGMRQWANKIDDSAWSRYSYLADGLANMRDHLRFSLSPIFDASRYSESIILSQIGTMPAGLRNLRINQSPTAFRRAFAKAERAKGVDQHTAKELAEAAWHQATSEFAAAARGYKDFDWEAIDSVARRFSSVGILGFSPTDWMSSMFANLRQSGVAPKKAYETVREIFTYGTTGRSAAELSMNMVFFPFSFTKKVTTHMSKFMADDMARLALLHDMFSTYARVDEHFDLSAEWRDRLPILERANRLNVLGYGIGLGRLGGINAPMIEALGSMPGLERVRQEYGANSAIVNAFIPQMVPMQYTEDANTVWENARGMFPVFNDINTMVDLMIQQGQVIGSDNHLTNAAESRRAYQEWREFQDELNRALRGMGVSWSQAVRNPHLGEYIQRERTRISLKYPAWKQEMGDGIAHANMVEMELKERIEEPQSPADFMLVAYEEERRLLGEAMGVAGFSWSQPEFIPDEVYAVMRRQAIKNAQQEPEFLRLYNRFYRRTFGDIATEIH